ncbi:MAG: protein translocase subunit SecD [Gammaproteobacteria bacterium]|nr:protein translocase subunit SecD [Gammaproteobacteria bacterium]|tara:strand:+ start:907 stop:2760 length:1854 start_codon:yes stop_codon:yes gene_type:complete
MLNTYPIWKYAIVVFATVLGVVYALPNVYPPDYAVQLSAEKSGVVLEERLLDLATDVLDSNDIAYFDPVIGPEGNGLIRMNDDAAQRRAQALIHRRMLEENESVVVALNLAATTPDWLRALGAEPMKYGLDLRGGVHFLMEVDTAKNIAERIESTATDIKRRLRTDKVRYKAVDAEGDTIRAEFNSVAERDQAEELLSNQYQDYQIISDDTGPLAALVFSVTDDAVREMQDFAVSQNVQTIRNRVNELGVSEPLVQQLGRSRIVVDLPGVQDTAEAKEILGKVATLEFRLEAKPGASRASTIQYDYEGRDVSLEKRIIVKGERVIDAQPSFDPETGLPQVNITLDGDGGAKMHRATRNDIGRRMAVIFIENKPRSVLVTENGEVVEKKIRREERRVISLATIQAALPSNFRITGLEPAEARELALFLRAGALAADMFIAEERTVGASLGQQNIDLGRTAVMVGMGLVILFMFAYYKVFGIAANVALTVNLVLLVSLMSLLSATLTLPGIAGIVLTVGMAVDANVLIFSRIKEELANRASPQAAISAGFDRAFVTILDANLTTLIVAIILYSIGTGPIKGFAVTLAIGIATSFFTAIWGTRAIVNLIYGGRNIKTLHI